MFKCFYRFISYKIKFLNKMYSPMHQSRYLRLLFYIQAGIAALNCYIRPDFNLPLFIFSAGFWDYQPS